jgi:hypothetical protein
VRWVDAENMSYEEAAELLENDGRAWHSSDDEGLVKRTHSSVTNGVTASNA